MTYNRKEHEKWIERSKIDPLGVMVLVYFEHKKYAFLEGFERWVE